VTFNHATLHPLSVNDDYAMHLDEYKRGQDQFLLLHLRFNRWTPSVFKRFITHWHLFRRCVSAPLFALGEVDDDKWEHFVTRFGFKYLQTVQCANGEHRRLFIHRTPEASNVRIRQQED
jgi:hypothetical protein